VPLKRTSFILADVQSNVLSPSCMHITAFFIDQQLKVSKSGGTRKVEYTYNFLKVCWCCLPKIIKIRPRLMKLQLAKFGLFVETQCSILVLW